MASGAYEKYDRPEDDGFSGSDNEHHDSARAQRTSEDVRRRDQETLTAEEEAERLLGREREQTMPGGGSRIGQFFGRSDGVEKGSRRKRKRAGRKSRKEQKRELMYEMEEGGPRSSSAESSGHSSEVDLRRLGETQARWKKVCVAYSCCNVCANEDPVE